MDKTKDSTSTVIDTGCDINHPDLMDNVWKNLNEIQNNRMNNNNNGYIDDINGWNYFDGNNGVYYSAKEDAHGFRDIARKANTLGVIGVAPNVKIIPLKFIGPYGGSLDDVISAFNYAKGKGV
jgi:subtilisin family serine protease